MNQFAKVPQINTQVPIHNSQHVKRIM